jgi:hypothetical protein
MLLLWTPGVGNFGVDHIHYLRQGYGVLSYYIIEQSDGKVIKQGFQPFNLICTIALTAYTSVVCFFDLSARIRHSASVRA